MNPLPAWSGLAVQVPVFLGQMKEHKPRYRPTNQTGSFLACLWVLTSMWRCLLGGLPNERALKGQGSPTLIHKPFCWGIAPIALCSLALVSLDSWLRIPLCFVAVIERILNGYANVSEWHHIVHDRPPLTKSIWNRKRKSTLHEYSSTHCSLWQVPRDIWKRSRVQARGGWACLCMH